LVLGGDAPLHGALRAQIAADGLYLTPAIVPPVDLCERDRPAVVVLVLRETGAPIGLQTVRDLRRADDSLPIILVVPCSSENLAIAALRAGVTDYFRTPLDVADLAAAIRRAASRYNAPGSGARHDVGATRWRGSAREATDSRFRGDERLVGDSPALRRMKQFLARVASADANVLITGESGTGKELAAELIHRNSRRARRPFISINCAAIPEGLLENELFGHERGAFTGAEGARDGRLRQADGGTVFLDEIGDMSLHAQAKILRATDTKEVSRLGGRQTIVVDMRIIAATNGDLDQLVRAGRFRQDLYFRLNVARVDMPPLRDRKEDLPALSRYFIREFNSRFRTDVQGLSDAALELLSSYDWPGNVRELRNVIEASFLNLSCGRIDVLDLPERFSARFGQAEGRSRDERAQLLAALHATNWNKTETARSLRWSRMTLYRKMAKYSITSRRRGEAKRAAVTL
jgi:DNA-binding NtrC family response regulator